MPTTDAQSISKKRNENLETEQVKKAVEFLMEHVNMWSMPSVAHILSFMIDIVAATEDIPPSVRICAYEQI